MKKYIRAASFTLALVVCSASLFSCGPKSGGNETEAAVLTDAPQGSQFVPPSGDETVYDLNAEAAELLSGFILYPDADYLADARFDTDEYLPGFDLDPNLSVSDLAHNIASDEDYIYVCIKYSDENDGGKDGPSRILRADKKTGEVLPLCASADCAHDGEDCGSYVCGNEDSVFAFRIYDGALYWFQQGRKLKLVRENADGSGREIVFENDCSVADGIAISELFIHRGVAYAAGVREVRTEIDGDWVDVTTGVITAFPLDGGEPYTVLSAGPMWDLFYGFLVEPMGNDLYIMMQGSNGKDLDLDKWGEEYSVLYKWSAKTRRAELLFAESYNTFGKSPETHGIYPVRGDGVYFQNLTEYKRGDSTWASRAGLLKYSFETKKVESVTDALSYAGSDFFVWMEFFGGRVTGPCVGGGMEGKICAFDLEGKAVSSVDVTPALVYKDLVSGQTSAQYTSYNRIIEMPLGDDGDFSYYYVRTMRILNSGESQVLIEEFYLAVPTGSHTAGDGSIRFEIFTKQ